MPLYQQHGSSRQCHGTLMLHQRQCAAATHLFLHCNRTGHDDDGIPGPGPRRGRAAAAACGRGTQHRCRRLRSCQRRCGSGARPRGSGTRRVARRLIRRHVYHGGGGRSSSRQRLCGEPPPEGRRGRARHQRLRVGPAATYDAEDAGPRGVARRQRTERVQRLSARVPRHHLADGDCHWRTRRYGPRGGARGATTETRR